MSVKVTQVTPAFVCTGAYAMPIENGQFVAVAFEVTTAPNYETLSGGQPMRFFWHDFFGYTSDTGAAVENAPSGYGCVDVAEELPLDIPAGATSTGVIVLDLPTDATSFSWVPTTFSLQDIGGWEWTI